MLNIEIIDGPEETTETSKTTFSLVESGSEPESESAVGVPDGEKALLVKLGTEEKLKADARYALQRVYFTAKGLRPVYYSLTDMVMNIMCKAAVPPKSLWDVDKQAMDIIRALGEMQVLLGQVKHISHQVEDIYNDYYEGVRDDVPF